MKKIGRIVNLKRSVQRTALCRRKVFLNQSARKSICEAKIEAKCMIRIFCAGKLNLSFF